MSSAITEEDLRAEQRRKLGALIEEARRINGFYREKLANIRFDAATDPLGALPFTTRIELERDQAEHPPFGRNHAFPISDYCRFHQTSGSTGAPLRVLDRPDDWRWWLDCWEAVYRAAELRSEDRLLFAFSFGPFVGFWSAFESAVRGGRLCLPTGGMSTSARLRLLVDSGATVVGCTPTYALRMAEVSREEGIDLARSPVRALIVAGEPGGSVPATRRRIESAWSARVLDHAGMTELGAYAFECWALPGALFVNERQFIAESIDPLTLRPAMDGEIGELVLTNLGRRGYPLIRYRTGDRVRLTRRASPAGNSFACLEGGLLGRIDDMLIVRGNNVHPQALQAILQDIPELVEYRLTLDRRGALAELVIEVEAARGTDGASLRQRVEREVQARLSFRPEVRVVAPGTLPRFEMKARRVVRQENEGVDCGS